MTRLLQPEYAWCAVVVGSAVAIGLWNRVALPNLRRAAAESMVHATSVTRAGVLGPGRYASGDEGAECTIVLFGDYRSRDARMDESLALPVLQTYGNRIALVFRYVPERANDPLAPGIELAEFDAQTSGLYSQMHGQLFGPLERAQDLLDKRKSLMLDPQSSRLRSEAGRDLKQATSDAAAIGLHGKPGFAIVNRSGKVYVLRNRMFLQSYVASVLG